jgi:hypothetical protein
MRLLQLLSMCAFVCLCGVTVTAIAPVQTLVKGVLDSEGNRLGKAKSEADWISVGVAPVIKLEEAMNILYTLNDAPAVEK